MKKKIALFNTIQFLASLNENLARLLCAFFLISLQGNEGAARIMSITGALFLTPFLLFSTLGGLLADKYSKSLIIRITRFMELIGFVLFFLGVLGKMIIFSCIILFALASISALFSPSKYGIIPEYVPKNRLLSANSLISSFTFLGIIIGTGLASLLLEIGHQHFLLAAGISIFIAFINFLLSLLLPATKAQFPKREIGIFYLKEFFFSLVELNRIPALLTVTMAFAYFLFLGSFIQFNIIPFSIDSLNVSAEIGGYLFTITAIGVSIGAAITTALSKGRLFLLLIPYSGFAISFIIILLVITTFSIYITFFSLLCLGLLGGFILVPSISYILVSSPDSTRGRNYSTANLLSFLFALFASAAVYLFNVGFGLKPATSFMILAAINVVVMSGIYIKLKANSER